MYKRALSFLLVVAGACSGARAPTSSSATSPSTAASQPEANGGTAPSSSSAAATPNDAGGACTIQAPQPLARGAALGTEGQRAIIVDDRYIWWIDDGDDSLPGIERIGKTRAFGEFNFPEQVVAQPAGARFTQLVVDCHELFWLELDATSRQPRHVWRADASGSGATSIVDFADPCIDQVGIAVDATDVYVAEIAKRGGTCSSGERTTWVKRVSRFGGALVDVTTVADWMYDLKIDDLGLYYYNGYSLRRLPKQGGDPAVLVGDSQEGLNYSLDAAHVYIGNTDDRAIWVLDKSGNPQLRFDPPAWDGTGAVVGDGNGQIFYSELGQNGDDANVQVREGDGSMRFIGWLKTRALALDAQYLYFSSDAQLYRVCR